MGVGRTREGRIAGPAPDGRLIERRVCAACDARLEREPLTPWRLAGTAEPLRLG